ncbi:glycosyltransferase [Rothia sp. P13129]|uniref:glycosyltransferase n=1 Tax=Rothia sp. P13129 TaxID=3402664 RepID=UPI003ACD0B2F
MHTSPLDQPGTADAGGMNVYILRSLQALLKLYPNLSVEVFTLDTSGSSSPSAQVSEVLPRTVVHSLQVDAAAGAAKDQLPALVDDFAKAVADAALENPDIVHSHYWLSGMSVLSLLEGVWKDYSVPWVHTMHTTAAAKDARSAHGEGKEPQIRYEGEQKICQQVTSLVVNTVDEAQQMVRWYGAQEEKTVVIPPGVDSQVFHDVVPSRRMNEGSSSECFLVFAGRPQPLKGLHILVETLALLPQDISVRCAFIGQGSPEYHQQLVSRAEELGVDECIDFYPSYPPEELAEFFRRADIVAVPSSSETFGLVALEAQACGAAVLASDVDGLKSAVADGVSGVLVSPRTPEAWAIAVEQMVRSPQRRRLLGQNGAHRAREKTWEHSAEDMLRLYRTLMSLA